MKCTKEDIKGEMRLLVSEYMSAFLCHVAIIGTLLRGVNWLGTPPICPGAYPGEMFMPTLSLGTAPSPCISALRLLAVHVKNSLKLVIFCEHVLKIQRNFICQERSPVAVEAPRDGASIG